MRQVTTQSNFKKFLKKWFQKENHDDFSQLSDWLHKEAETSFNKLILVKETLIHIDILWYELISLFRTDKVCEFIIHAACLFKIHAETVSMEFKNLDQIQQEQAAKSVIDFFDQISY